MAEFRDAVDIAAAPETVYEYLVTAEGMTAWMGQHAELEPLPGGRFAVDIAGHAIRGEFLHVEPPRRIVVSWGMVGSESLPTGASRVEFLLIRTSTGTRVELTHSALPDLALRGHAHGWAHFLPRLAVAGGGGDAGTDDWRPLDDEDHRPHDKESDMETAHEIVRRYHRAWTSGDVEQAMTYIADDITCRAPGADLRGKEAYSRYIAGFAPTLTGIGDFAEFSDGDRVALFYYPQTAATSTAPAAEYFTVRDALISESVLIFDRLSYGPPKE